MRVRFDIAQGFAICETPCNRHQTRSVNNLVWIERMGSHQVSVSGSKQTASQAGLRRLSHFLAGLPSEFYRREGQFAIDVIVSAISVLVAYRLRFDSGIPRAYQDGMWILAMAFPAIRMVSILL